MWSSFLLETGTGAGFGQDAFTESSKTLEMGSASTEDDLVWSTSKMTRRLGGGNAKA